VGGWGGEFEGRMVLLDVPGKKNGSKGGGPLKKGKSWNSLSEGP